MRKVLVVNPSITPPGGGNAVAAWALQALTGHCDLSLLSWGELNLGEVNRFYGTSLAPNDFRLFRIRPAVRGVTDLVPSRGALLRTLLMARRCQELDRVHRFDVLLSATNEMDFGRRGIQYVHFPWAHLPRPDVDLSWYHRFPGSVAAYHALCRAIARTSLEGLKGNLTLVNSDYVAGVVRETHGIGSDTLYPPVPGCFPKTPWEQREDAFACVGRLSPEKRLEEVIRILESVRGRGWPITLNLVGTPGPGRYTRRIRRLVHRNASWIRLHLDLDRPALLDLMGRCRYGIHGMVGEHFGIAPAELQRAGCIVFASGEGGPREILGGDERVLFDSDEDAVDKIQRVLSDAALQGELRTAAARRAGSFTTERFVSRVREIVAAFEA